MTPEEELANAIEYAEKQIATRGDDCIFVPGHLLKILLDAAKQKITADQQDVLDGKRVLLPTDKVMADAYVLIGMSWLKNHDPDEGNS